MEATGADGVVLGDTTGAQDDPDGDGLTNGEEWALGGRKGRVARWLRPHTGPFPISELLLRTERRRDRAEREKHRSGLRFSWRSALDDGEREEPIAFVKRYRVALRVHEETDTAELFHHSFRELDAEPQKSFAES